MARWVTTRGSAAWLLRARVEHADGRRLVTAVTDSNTKTNGIACDRWRARIPKFAIVPKPKMNISR